MDKALVFTPQDLSCGLSITGDPALEAARPTAALVNPLTSACGDGVGSSPGEGQNFDIVQQGSVYHLALDLDYIDIYADSDRSLLSWLYERNAKETVYLAMTNAYPPGNFYQWADYFAPLFEALINCPAKVVGLLDGPVMGVGAYVLMACHAIQIGPYGLYTVYPGWLGTEGGVTAAEMAVRAFIRKLYARAVMLQLLTEDEVAQLEDSQFVTVDVRQFANASFEHLTIVAAPTR